MKRTPHALQSVLGPSGPARHKGVWVIPQAEHMCPWGVVVAADLDPLLGRPATDPLRPPALGPRDLGPGAALLSPVGRSMPESREASSVLVDLWEPPVGLRDPERDMERSRPAPAASRLAFLPRSASLLAAAAAMRLVPRPPWPGGVIASGTVPPRGGRTGVELPEPLCHQVTASRPPFAAAAGSARAGLPLSPAAALAAAALEPTIPLRLLVLRDEASPAPLM
mmetsp:Transcript_19043/g.61097  ORF Transcript_19043/g.61097 Transcript_19043/m.61097 type:complete len:224 (-) Transcript_19043:132-803(-)